MNIEDLGNLGEFIAALAVVASLVYLGYQVRENTRELGLQSFQRVFEGYANFRRYILQSPDLTRIHLKAVENPDELTAEELMQLGYLLEEYLFSSQQYYLHLDGGRFGALPNENPRWHAAVKRLAVFLASKPAIEWWQEWKHMYFPAFQKEVDAIVKDFSQGELNDA